MKRTITVPPEQIAQAEARYLALYEEWQTLTEEEKERRREKLLRHLARLRERGIYVEYDWSGPIPDLTNAE